MSEKDSVAAVAQVYYETINTWISETRDGWQVEEFMRYANLTYALYISIKNGFVRIADLTRAGRDALYEGYDYLWTNNLIPHNEGN